MPATTLGGPALATIVRSLRAAQGAVPVRRRSVRIEGSGPAVAARDHLHPLEGFHAGDGVRAGLPLPSLAADHVPKTAPFREPTCSSLSVRLATRLGHLSERDGNACKGHGLTGCSPIS